MPADPLLRVRDLSKTYFRHRWLRSPQPVTLALAGVSFTLERARTLAVIGASGCGKSTLARCLTQFETPTGGEILFEGCPLSKHRRLEAQLIFQQPAASLNPRFTAAEIVEEPLLIQYAGARTERRERAAAALELTGIARATLGKRAHEFSGENASGWPSPARSWPNRSCSSWTKVSAGSIRCWPRRSPASLRVCRNGWASPTF